MKKSFVILGALIAGLLLLLFVVAVSLGYFPGVSDAIGLGSPKNLGVTYTDDDYLSAKDKLDNATETQVVAETFTEAELTALVNGCTESACVVQDAQVDTHADGTLELSGSIDKEKISSLILDVAADAANDSALSTALMYMPPQPAFYVEAEVVGENDVVILQLEQASVAGVELTGQSLEELEGELNRMISEYLASLPDTQLTELTVSDEGIYLEADLTQVNEEDLH